MDKVTDRHNNCYIRLYSNIEKIDIVNKINEGKINEIPNKLSQINHIYRKKEGHLLFSENNIRLLSNLINNDKNIILINSKNGNTWYAKIDDDGSQIWGKVYNNKLSNGGLNTIPRKLDIFTGLDNNQVKEKSSNYVNCYK